MPQLPIGNCRKPSVIFLYQPFQLFKLNCSKDYKVGVSNKKYEERVWLFGFLAETTFVALHCVSAKLIYCVAVAVLNPIQAGVSYSFPSDKRFEQALSESR